ncbi:MAG: Crp/Fnr family transcriptional regulator, partial [Alphaproteobacteria bacterium]
MTDTKCRLHEIRLFAELDDAQIEKIDKLCDWMQLPKGKEIVSQEDQSNAVFFIASGKVAAKSYSTEGKEVTFTEIPAGEICGEFAAIDQLPRSASVQTVAQSCIARMSAAQFRELVKTVPLLGYKLAEMLVKKNRSLSERIYEFSTMTVRHRVCAELVRIAEAEGGDANTVTINPAPSHYQ